MLVQIEFIQDGQRTYNITLRRVRATSCSGKAIRITYSECVCVCLALGVHHAMRMRLSMSSVACPAQQCLSTLSHKQHDSRGKKMLLNIKCVF